MNSYLVFAALLLAVFSFCAGVGWDICREERPKNGLKTPKKQIEFSKLILLFETALVAYVSHRVLGFVESAIRAEFSGSLPYLTTFISAVWAAYGASVSFYQNKSGKENVKKIEAGAVNQTPDC